MKIFSNLHFKKSSLGVCALVLSLMVGFGFTGGGQVKAYADTMDSPVITVKASSFILKTGEGVFNLTDALGLNIQDTKDGDITSTVVLPTIDTSKPVKKSYDIKATNSKGVSATKRITVNILGVTDLVHVTSFKDISAYDLKNLVNGDVTECTMTAMDLNESANAFTLEIKDKVDGLLKIPMSVKVDGTGDLSGIIDDSKSPSKDTTAVVDDTMTTTEDTATLPATGDFSTQVPYILIIAGVAILALLYFTPMKDKLWKKSEKN